MIGTAAFMEDGESFSYTLLRSKMLD